MPKFKKCDYGLQPSVMFQTGRHWQWGFSAGFGFRNMMLQYPEYNKSGNTHFANLLFNFGWRF